jgi:serine/threonine-protein kinase
MDIRETISQPDAPDTLVPGMFLGNHKYELRKQIGCGAMGVVWQAHERIADRLVALKFVPKEFARFKDEIERMKKSFSKIHDLHHQSICPIYGLEDGDEFGFFLVMKFLEGETLTDYALRKDPKQDGLPLDKVIDLCAPVASALDYAHLHDVIHRDIKPSNIFLSETSRRVNVVVIDFGLADEIRTSLSRTSQVKLDISGTPAYMAPEQWQGHRQTAATDQYALAVVVYELLAGHLPFSGSNIENAVLKYVPEPILNVPDNVNAALQKALAKNDGERFESCAEFIAALGAKTRCIISVDEWLQKHGGTRGKV